MKLITFVTNISYFVVKFIAYIEISELTKSTGKCINAIIYLFFVLFQQQTWDSEINYVNALSNTLINFSLSFLHLSFQKVKASFDHMDSET
jgi:hypothetical protein